MKILALVCALSLGLGAQSAAGATAGQNVTGVVINATTGKPLANTAVALIRLQGAMQTAANTATDGEGRYRFSESEPGPYMVEATYQGVHYFARVTAGQSETNLKVYTASGNPAAMQVDAEIMVLQPANGQLAIVSEYRVENPTQPPYTLAAKKGLFRFRVAQGAKVDMVRVVGPGEMPLSRQAIATADPNVYAVDTPLRPGETRIQISYRVPYPALKAALTVNPPVRPSHFEIYVPSPMTFSASGFTQVGQQDGYNVYGAPEPVPASMTFNVAGDAPLPQAANQAANPQNDSGSSAAGTGATNNAAADGSAATAVGPVPAPTFVERNRWTLLALLGLAAAAGFGFLLARPQPAPLGGAAGVGETGIGSLGAAPAVKRLAASAAAPAAGDALSRLKDDLFLLEVQHHTGHLEEAEYQRRRAELNRRMEELAQALATREPSYTGS